MYPIKESGSEKLSNNFVSIIYNDSDKHYHIFWNGYFKSPLSKIYKISNDYDFGSIQVKDLLVELYICPNLANVPGISRVIK